MFENDFDHDDAKARIEKFIRIYDGTSIGSDVKNMYENGTSFERILERIENYNI